MSYLLGPRVVFAGRFVSDVSTLNNLAQANHKRIDGWNAVGTGAFEFLNCAVTGAWNTVRRDPAGPVVNHPDDPCLGYVVNSNPEDSAAKMVDLDPSWQLASEIWCLRVQIVDPRTSKRALSGRFDVASFRDLWTRQLSELVAGNGRTDNGQPMGARYVSTLTDVQWGPAAADSAVLTALRRQAKKRELSISLHQFGFFYATAHPRWRTGTLIGAIGVRRSGEPRTAVIHRRIDDAPDVPILSGRQLSPVSAIDVEVAADESRLGFDLGHALPIDNVDGRISHLGELPAVPQLNGCTALVLAVKTKSFTPWRGPKKEPSTIIAEVDEPFTDAGWYRRTGGVVETTLTTAMAAAIRDAPLALYARMADGNVIAISSETTGGVFARTDTFVRRMDPGDTETVTFHVRRFGRPAAAAPVYLSKPQAPLFPPLGDHDFGGEPLGVHLAGAGSDGVIYTDDNGVAIIHLTASDPGQPRNNAEVGHHPVDGQVYTIHYSPRGRPGTPDTAGTGLIDFDVIAVHVRGHLEVPKKPDWDLHVEPILADYALLYPVMSRHLFDIGDFAAVTAHRRQMTLAFSRRIDDPNYMPVTRDMSAARRQIILRWLRSAQAREATAVGPPRAAPRRTAAPQPSEQETDFDAKRDTPRRGAADGEADG